MTSCYSGINKEQLCFLQSFYYIIKKYFGASCDVLRVPFFQCELGQRIFVFSSPAGLFCYALDFFPIFALSSACFLLDLFSDLFPSATLRES